MDYNEPITLLIGQGA